MKRKRDESEFKKLMTSLDIWAHKWSDVRRCPRCHAPIYVTQRIEGEEEEEKSSIVDYLIFVGAIPAWVECKQTGTNTFPLDYIQPHQIRFMNDWTERGLQNWLFLLMGEGRAPRGRWGYLIPWQEWTEKVSEEKLGRKSLTAAEAAILFGHCELVYKGGWSLPPGHPFIKYYGGSNANRSRDAGR